MEIARQNERRLCATGVCLSAQYAPHILREWSDDNAKKAGAKCARNPHLKCSLLGAVYMLCHHFLRARLLHGNQFGDKGLITMQHIFDDARQGIVWIARNPLYNAAGQCGII